MSNPIQTGASGSSPCVVVGGGFAGVETVGAINDLARDILPYFGHEGYWQQNNAVAGTGTLRSGQPDGRVNIRGTLLILPDENPDNYDVDGYISLTATAE